MTYDAIIETVIGGIIMLTFSAVIWMGRQSKNDTDKKIEDLEHRVTAAEREVARLALIAANQQEMKEDVKAIHAVVTELRIVIASMDRSK